MSMAECGDYIRSKFPTIDDELYHYVESNAVMYNLNN